MGHNETNPYLKETQMFKNPLHVAIDHAEADVTHHIAVSDETVVNVTLIANRVGKTAITVFAAAALLKVGSTVAVRIIETKMK